MSVRLLAHGLGDDDAATIAANLPRHVHVVGDVAYLRLLVDDEQMRGTAAHLPAGQGQMATFLLLALRAGAKIAIHRGRLGNGLDSPYCVAVSNDDATSLAAGDYGRLSPELELIYQLTKANNLIALVRKVGPEVDMYLAAEPGPDELRARLDADLAAKLGRDDHWGLLAALPRELVRLLARERYLRKELAEAMEKLKGRNRLARLLRRGHTAR